MIRLNRKRAELISMLFVCGNLGVAIPVIGIGVLAALTSPRLADLTFSGVIALLSVGALAFGLIKSRQTRDRRQ